MKLHVRAQSPSNRPRPQQLSLAQSLILNEVTETRNTADAGTDLNIMISCLGYQSNRFKKMKPIVRETYTASTATNTVNNAWPIPSNNAKSNTSTSSYDATALSDITAGGVGGEGDGIGGSVAFNDFERGRIGDGRGSKDGEDRDG